MPPGWHGIDRIETIALLDIASPSETLLDDSGDLRMDFYDAPCLRLTSEFMLVCHGLKATSTV
jgi:hypothetical protein